MSDLAKRDDQAQLLERVLLDGDLSKLTPAQRVEYYRRVCESLGLNPLTKPFDYITLNGRLTLYARRDCTDQLRRRDRISVSIVSREVVSGVYVVCARATAPDGRTDESIGAVNIEGLKGEALANAMMKAETKAKRRVTLSICGLGFLDETEVPTVPDAQVVEVDVETGEVVEQPQAQRAEAEQTLERARAYFARAEDDTVNASDKQAQYLAALLNESLGDGPTVDAERHAWLEAVCGVTSCKDLGRGQANKMLDFLTQGNGGLNPKAAERVRAVMRAIRLEQGQQWLPLDPRPEDVRAAAAEL